jgi:hypothetical protein
MSPNAAVTVCEGCVVVNMAYGVTDHNAPRLSRCNNYSSITQSQPAMVNLKRERKKFCHTTRVLHSDHAAPHAIHPV